MSELIYMMGCIDKRFQPLLFTIRSWAAARKITNPAPGRTPTNFTLVLLLVYFLQHKKILPTFDVLFNHPGMKFVTCLLPLQTFSGEISFKNVVINFS